MSRMPMALPCWCAALLLFAGCCHAFKAEVNEGDTAPLLDESRLTMTTLPPSSTGIVPFTASSSEVQIAAAKLVGLAGPTHLKLTKDETDDMGKRHVRFQQVLPYPGNEATVQGGDFIVHLDEVSNSVYAVTGMVVKDVKVQLPPTVSRGSAVGKAVAEARRRLPSAAAAAAQTVLNAKLELQVVPTAVGDVVAWCGEADHTDSDVPGILRVCVSGHGAGEVKESRNVLHTVTGSGRGILCGTVSIDTTSASGAYQLKDPIRGGHSTNDMKNRQGGAQGTIFTDADNVWGDSTTSDRASAAVDAHYGAAMTFDYYKNVHGRNGIGNDGTAGYSRVHYGKNYANAFWSDRCKCMTYGDGDGVYFTKPLVALDVVGHEMTHGVTSLTAGLVYSGESGGLNEAMSDIFGTMVEWYANNPYDRGDYLIGERISAVPLRFMNNPPLDGSSPACYTSTIGSLDVHYSSGVANYWFYLLAEGGTEYLCNDPAVTLSPIGRDAAAKITYKALTTYMTSSTNYAAARVATLNAAKDLYTDTSAQYSAVAAAWTAIKVV